ncbi:hypothetical protein HO173_005757 [Letharia columbiana]|uniref:F-box domain-containing protein n=1 Tax=Letharia columbiana TaxID=112416 RepID=A0A8H6FWJ6_9LECA|nr:uncharacterized protein HO173_005757 [Letharia columbiana]KAF6236128.1 hypothetical protein HO173_005757 [Letharia columbiana]
MGSNLNLYTLPTELQHHIVLNLHPSAAIALKQTNRYFHTHISLYRLDPLKVKQYLHQVELRPRHRENYACFSCLRVKPKIAFTVSQLGAKKSRNGAYSSGRFCIDCGVRDKRFKPGTVLDIAGDESHPKAFCRSCSTIQSYFCGKCQRLIKTYIYIRGHDFLIDGHFKVPENTIMQGSNLEDSCGRWTKLTEIDAVDLSTVHGHILVITSAGFIAYEYKDGPMPDLSSISKEFFIDFAEYFVTNRPANLLGLQGLIENMDQTKALPCWMPQPCAAAHQPGVPGEDSKLGMGSRTKRGSLLSSPNCPRNETFGARKPYTSRAKAGICGLSIKDSSRNWMTKSSSVQQKRLTIVERPDSTHSVAI